MRLVSMTGVSASTVISSAIAATFIPNMTLTFMPVFTMTSRFTVANPASATTSL